jgi:hypothetical protein
MSVKHHCRRFAGSVLATLMVAAPVQAQTEFQGGGFLTGFNEPCAADGWSGTTQIVARSRPAAAPGNSATETIINLFVGNFVMHYRFPQTPYATGGWSTATGYAQIGGGFMANPATMPRVRKLPDPVGTVFGGDEAAHTVFEIENFAGVTGCTTRASIWVHRR